MAQRVDFAAFPGVREENMLATMNKVYGHIRRNQMTSREFRDWLKDENLWNKDEAPALFSFLDVLQDGVVRLGPWAERFFAADTEEAMRDQVYRRLIDENTLLVKYTLEALDAEGGGRLHSTHELHRLMTSYVYPGKQITLEPFKTFIKWLVVSGRMKLIGIRWGLTDMGKQAVPRLRTIDVDEFLEDEKNADAAPAPAPAPVVAAPPPRPAPSASEKLAAPPPAKAAPAKAAAKGDDEEFEEDLDMPPEPEPVDEAAFAKYAAQFEAPIDEPAPAPTPAKAATKAKAEPKAAPAPAPIAVPELQPLPQVAQAPSVAAAQPLHTDTTPPQVVVRFARVEAACQRAPLDPAAVVQALRDHGRTAGFGGGSLLLAHGLESRMAQNEPARHLFLAALLARCYAVTGDATLADELLERTGGTLTPLALLLDRPEALVDGLVRWNLAGSTPAVAQLRAVLTDAAIGGRALKAQADLPQQLVEAPSAEVLIGTLGQTVLRGAQPVACFWLVREMVRAGLWTRPSHSEIAFVPWRCVRLMAYRLRLIDSHFALGVPQLLTVAKRLAALFPPSSVEAAALEALAPADHLRFDCNGVVACQQPCAVHAPQA